MHKRVLLALAVVVALANVSCGRDKVIAPPKPSQPRSPAELIDKLASAYRDRDYPSFAALLASESGAPYIFLLDKPTEMGETQWGLDEELRIHRRMFDPQHLPDGELPVPSDIWVSAITIDLTMQGSFVERTGLGLDPTRWKATEAIYNTHVYWDLAGPLDYVVNGRADFIVVEDLAKPSGEPGKFTLYRWQDLERYPGQVQTDQTSSWSKIKSLYD